MFKKSTAKKLIAQWLICSMLLISLQWAEPEQALAETLETTSIRINTMSKQLQLGSNRADNYDFNVVDSDQLTGATYSWYVKADKGNPDAVTIDRKTGLVTAKEAGTAYIRCKVTQKDGTILRPEAKVTVYNDISGVSIRNLPEDKTITAGYAVDFNRTITNTAAGAGKKTEGITRWEIAEDTAGVGSADNKGIVYPVKEGEFKIRAVCFQSNGKYQMWQKDKSLYGKYITAASDWLTVKVGASDGKATVNTKEQLNKALSTEGFNEITLSSDKFETFVIEQGDYSAKAFIVDAPNADVKNYGVFQNITIKAIKDTTWIEYADGNIVNLQDSQLSFVVDREADIKQIVIDQPGSLVNLEINGNVKQITVLQPATINLSGGSTEIPLTVEANAGQSIINTSSPIQMTLHANAEVNLNPGSENTKINKSAGTIEVKIDNKSVKSIAISTNNGGLEVIAPGISGISNETTIPSQSQSSNNNDTAVEMTVSPSSMILSVSGSALYMLSAVITPESASDLSVTWRSMEEDIARVDEDGVITPVGLGTTPIIATSGDLYAISYITVVSGSALTVSGSAIQPGLLQSAQSTIAKELAKGAASYVGGELMGWGLKEAGIGFEDATETALKEMNKKLDQIAQQLSDLEQQLNEAVAQIEKQILDSEFNIRVGQMSSLIGQVKSIRGQLNNYIIYNDKIADKEGARTRIINNIANNLIGNEYLIHNQLVGIGSQESLIKVFSRAVKMDHRFLSSKDSATIRTMYEYYETVQTNLLELMVEYYHATGEGGDNCYNIDQLIKAYNENIAAQEKLLLNEVPENALIDTKLNIMIYTGYYRNPKYPMFSKSKTVRGPFYMNVFNKDYAFNMCNPMGYTDWRFITYEELQSWIKDSKSNLLPYLQNSGWEKPNMNKDLEIGIYSVPFAYADMYNIIDCYGYNVGNGKEVTQLSSTNGGKSYFTPNIFRDAESYGFYWIVCRTMKNKDHNEITNYFW